MKNNRVAIIIDGEYPPIAKRTDYKAHIDYLIEHSYARYIFSGNCGLPKCEQIKNTLIVRTDFKVESNTRRGEILSLFFFIFNIVKYRKRIDILYIYYFSTSLMVILIAKLCGIKVVTNYISVPLKRIIAGKILRYLCCILSDRNVLSDMMMKKDMFILYTKKKMYSLPLGIDNEIIQKILSNKHLKDRMKDKYSLDNKFTFVHLGIIDKTRQLSNIIDAFKLLEKERSNVVFLFIGDGPDSSRLKKYMEHNNISNVIFTGKLIYEEAISLTAQCQVGITYYPISIFNSQIALKTLEYLAMSIPVIAVDTYGNRKYISYECNGILIQDNSKSLYLAMRRLLDEKDLYNGMKMNISCLGEKNHYSYINDNYLKPLFDFK